MTDEPNIRPEDFQRENFQPETEQQSERHASNLELFLDLVFVFAVTQIAGLFAPDTGPGGFGQGVLLAWLQYVPLAAIAPVLVLAGTAFDRGPRTIVWCVVAAFNVGSAVFAGHRGGTGDTQWTIDPVHFVERHSLFVIISLG